MLLHTEYKLSDTLKSLDDMKSAALILAKSSLECAIENQNQNYLQETYEALEAWGFSDIIDCYFDTNTVFDHWYNGHDDVRIKEPCDGTYYDELYIDIEDRQAFEDVKSLAVDILEDLAKKL